MNTIILAAGQGTRLHPYTVDRPKCMVSLGGKPLLHWQLEVLHGCGIENITLVAGYKAENIDASGVKTIVNPKYASTNMVETLFCAREDMSPNEDLLICYGDIVYESVVLKTLIKSTAPVNISADRQWKRLWQLRMDEPLEDAETFKMDTGGAVIEVGKKPRSYEEIQAQYMGLIFVRGEYVEKFVTFYDKLDRGKIYDGKNFSNMYMTSFIQQLIDNGWHVSASLVNNGWLEIDTAEELEMYQKLHDSGKLREYCDLASNNG